MRVTTSMDDAAATARRRGWSGTPRRVRTRLRRGGEGPIRLASIGSMSPSRPSPSKRRIATVEETSAGGLVVDRSGAQPQAALIARLDRRGRLRWSLPKGHIEAGESRQDAAIREVEEETGIRGTVVDFLGTIDFRFMAAGRRVHKTVHHYLLEAQAGTLSDADVEVDEVAWVPLAELADRLAYADERRLVARVPDLLAGHG
jgi:8-oxo-dGTP pyrophosphatase MutT (NUDIX family)